MPVRGATFAAFGAVALLEVLAVAGASRIVRRAYLPDPATAVVLRWKSGACVMVSSGQPRTFVEELRRRFL